MKPDSVVSVVAMSAGLALMIALPAAYRIWTMCHPPAEHVRPTVAEVLEKASEESGAKLLKIPRDKWTEADIKAAPWIYEWLGEKASKVLPWEWSAEAVRKDPAGYAASLADVFAGLRRSHDEALSSVRGKLEALDSEAEAERTMCGHAEDELAKFSAVTGGYPQTVERTTLSKGRLWGWNRKTERVKVESEEALRGIVSALEAEIRSRRGRVESLASTRRAFEESAASHARAIADIDDCVAKRVSAIRDDPALARSAENVRETERCIVRAIMAVAR